MKRSTELLSKHTWLNIGGPAEIATPETKAEFVELLTECHENDRNYRILGGGSNLLVDDNGIQELVIKSTDACTNFDIDETKVKVGASVMIPQFIKQCVENDLGGYEYLYSVPGTVGGAIYMNAGRGKSHGLTITDHLIAVEVFVDNEVQMFEVDELEFDYRWSMFHEHNDWVILSATFDMPEQPAEEGNRRIRERMEKVGERERAKPNAGSVFKSGNRLPLHRVPPNGLSIDGAWFISANRICHDGNASFDDVHRLLKRAKLLNSLVPPFKSPVIEWEIWQ